MAYEDQEYELWLEQVNRLIEIVVGLGLSDLKDNPYRDWFDEGMSANEAAKKAVKAEFSGE
jgi:hypothetical protein